MERPVDLGVFGTGLSVDELPAHVRRRRHPVDLDHVVFPLDPLRSLVTVLGLAILTVVSVAVPVVPVSAVLLVCFAFAVMAVVSVVVVAFMLVAAVVSVVLEAFILVAGFVLVALMAVSVMLVSVTATGFDDVRRQELHAALGAAVRLFARHLWMHRAHVCRLFRRLREQFHAALRAAAGLLADNFGMHRADVNDRNAFGHPHIHLGDER